MAKSILITGCSSGIGYDCAHYLRDKGWQVFASCRREADCERLRAEGFAAPRLDYQDDESLETGLTEVLGATGGTLDALFHNGAFATPGAVEDIPREGLRANFEANFFGPHALTCRVLPVMRTQGHGRILQCSSVLGFTAMQWRGSYVSTKFALEGLTDTLRLELRGTGIYPILIQPGPVGTDIRRKAIPHFERWVDWKASALREKYESTLLNRLYREPTKPDRFEVTPRAVSRVVLRALTDPRPATRYKITTPTFIAAAMRRALPRRLIDNLLARA